MPQLMKVKEGGKTGLMFFISVFFLPIFASIPFWGTGSALVIVGSLMIRKWVLFLQAMIYDVSICSPRDCWNKLGLSWQRRSRLPHHSPHLQVCLVCLTAHSFNSPCLLNGIAYGVLAGVISYILLNPFFLRKISGGRIAPENYGNSERWVISPGSILPFWVRKLLGSTEAEDNCLDFEARQTSRTGTEPDSMIGKAGSVVRL